MWDKADVRKVDVIDEILITNIEFTEVRLLVSQIKHFLDKIQAADYVCFLSVTKSLCMFPI